MSARIAAFIRRNVVGLIAIFIAVGGTAYASNEWMWPNSTRSTPLSTAPAVKRRASVRESH